MKTLSRALLLFALVSLAAVPLLRGQAPAPARGQAPAPTPARWLDWPQFRGPARDGISQETGLLQSWPGRGPSTVWAVAGLGGGYGSLAVRGDAIFVQGLR